MTFTTVSDSLRSPATVLNTVAPPADASAPSASAGLFFSPDERRHDIEHDYRQGWCDIEEQS